MKLLLLTTKQCHRNCRWCCNKFRNLEALSICNSYKGYEEIIITGGEPTLFSDQVVSLVKMIRQENSTALLTLYTTRTENLPKMGEVFDKIFFTIHSRPQIEDLIEVEKKFMKKVQILSFVEVSEIFPDAVKLQWEKTPFPIPGDEVFMRLPMLF